jgi:hypothetical protein
LKKALYLKEEEITSARRYTMKNVAINGLDRIGRLALRQNIGYPSENFQITAANSLTSMDDT